MKTYYMWKLKYDLDPKIEMILILFSSLNIFMYNFQGLKVNPIYHGNEMYLETLNLVQNISIFMESFAIIIIQCMLYLLIK